jgi:aryl-alcohol dehydrogenase-like predicted oxidoreductase
LVIVAGGIKDMKYRKLGDCGLKLSELTLGSWLTYGHSIDKNQAFRTIHTAYENGICSFDAANEYAKGEAEKVLGEALKYFPRESYVIATKAFNPVGEGPNDRGLSRKHIFDQVHASLKRMNLDYIDIFYCSRYDHDTPVGETLRIIDDLISQGKILYAGVSRWKAIQVQEALRIADKYLLDRIVVDQTSYNLLDRDIEKFIIPTCIENGLGLVVFSPLAQGMLSGKYKKGQPVPKGSRGDNPEGAKFIERYMNDINFDKVERLTLIADKLGITLSQMSLAWILSHEYITSAVTGASSPEQVLENVKAVDIALSKEILDEIDKIIED